MFAKLKLRSKLILLGKRFSVFIKTLLFFIFRFFCFLALCASCISLVLIVSQRREHERLSLSFFIFVCFLLLMVAFISLYFLFWLGFKRSLYFEKLIEGENYQKKEMSFLQELKCCLQSIYAGFVVLGLRLLWLLFFCSPALLLSAFLYFRLSSGSLARNVFFTLLAGVACLLFFGFLFYFCTIQRYLLVIKFVSLKGLGVRAAIKESTRLIDGSSAVIAAFKLGLGGWYLLSPLIVPFFYTVPYSRLSFELLCKKYMSGEVEVVKNEADINLFSTKRLPQI